MVHDRPATGFRALLSNGGFLRLWLAQLVSQFGDFVALMALFSLVAFRAGGTPGQVSGIMVAFLVPFAFLGPVAGVLVDRWDVKRTLIGSDLVRAVLAAALAFSTQLTPLYVLFFALSTVSCLFLPAQMVALPLLVRTEHLLAANALNAQAMQVNKVLAPALAGVLVATAGEKACFIIDSLTFLVSAALISTIPLRREQTAAPRRLGSLAGDLLEGLRFLSRHRALSFVIASTVLALLATGVFDALIAIYVRDILSATPQVFSGVVSLVGAGTILGAVIVGRLGQEVPRVHLVALGILTMGLAVMLMAASSRLTVAFAASLWLGLGAAGVVIPSQTLIQEESPPALLGRVGSTFIALLTAAKLVGVTAAGSLAGWLEIVNVYYLVASMLILTGAFGYGYARARGVARATVP